MPKPETVEELAESLADMLGLHNRGIQKHGLTVEQTRRLIDATGEWHFDHAESCQCRMCWCGELGRRIRAAVANDNIRNNPMEENVCP
jgi:hypothetical protein